MNVLLIVAFHSNVVRVVNDEIIFRLELNISVVSFVIVVSASA